MPARSNPDLVVGVAHDFCDGLVGQQRVERAVAERVLNDLFDEALALDRRDLHVFPRDDAVERLLDLDGQCVAVEARHARGQFGEHEVADLALRSPPRTATVMPRGGARAIGERRAPALGRAVAFSSSSAASFSESFMTNSY